ncbi:MAG: ComEC/Rec2 family competence protein [Planctomycetota bacterium]
MTEGRLERAGAVVVVGALAGLPGWNGVIWLTLAAACGLGWAVAGRVQSDMLAGGDGSFVAGRAMRWPTSTSLLGWLAVGFAMAGWSSVAMHRVAANDAAAWVGSEPTLVRVSGRVAEAPRIEAPQRGTLGRFSYQQPATRFDLVLSGIRAESGWRETSGRLRVRLDEAEPRLRRGDRVEAVGWVSGFGPVMNPGGFDYGEAMRRRGIDGTLHVASRGGLRRIDAQVADDGLPTPNVLERAWVRAEAWRARFAAACLDSLRLGLAGAVRSDERALASTMLLGVWDGLPEDLQDDFRRVGLAHLLSISGAHLSILLGVVWAVLRLIGARPSRVAVVVLAVLLLYLLAVPWRTPILRASLMATLLTVGFASGRSVRAADMLGLSAVLLLGVQPRQVIDPGFQLSFGVVWALLRFTEPMALWMWGVLARLGLVLDVLEGESLDAAGDGVAGRVIGWRGVAVQLVAGSVVASAASGPLVAYHFGLLTPAGVVLSVVALPLVAGMLAVGYAKLLVGLVLPSASLVLAGPMLWLTRSLVALAEAGGSTGWVGWEMGRAVGLGWTIAATGVVVGWLGGVWRRRARRGGAAAGVVIAGWLMVIQMGGAAGIGERWAGVRGDAPFRVSALAVGEGSCFVVRPSGGGRGVWVFDCGSRGDWNLARRRVEPALRRMGVAEIDTLVVSHADIDHFNGVLDLADAMPVRRVLTSPQVMAATERDRELGRDTSLVALMDGLVERRVPVQEISAGFTETMRAAEAVTVECLWPPRDYVSERDNDASLVLAWRIGDRRVRLSGDIQDAAIAELLERGVDLAADVADLPHHGAYSDRSADLLDATRPSVVMQSAGPRRLEDDPWAELLSGEPAVQRLVTARDGMATVTVRHDGRVETTRFLGAVARPTRR